MSDGEFARRVRILLKRKSAYRRLFLDGNGQLTGEARVVLGDLARFCNANKSSTRLSATGIDVNATLIGEGRREVFLRLSNMLFLDERAIVDLPRHAETE